MKEKQPDFDLIARPYRWLEYLTLGHTLQRSRLFFLADLRACTNALVLGDGDGRFLARLFAQNPGLHADAVDTSRVMLTLLRRRCPPGVSLRTHRTNALTYLGGSENAQYDLVVTHFFLDCLTQSEVNKIALDVAPHLAKGALWVVTEFAIPPGFVRLPATLLLRSLYFAFQVLTGLRIKHLPDHRAALHAAGFVLIRQRSSLLGILESEVWKWDEAPPEIVC